MKRLMLKEVLAGYRMRDEIRIRIEGNILIFCGTVMRFRRKCIFGQFSKYMNYKMIETEECENGVFVLCIFNPETYNYAEKDT